MGFSGLGYDLCGHEFSLLTPLGMKIMRYTETCDEIWLSCLVVVEMSVECVCVYAAHMPISMYICNYAETERERERERERILLIIEYSWKRHS